MRTACAQALALTMERKLKNTVPTPSTAAYFLRRFLQSKEHDISLSTAQEAVARLNGFNDWNTLAAAIDPRGRASTKRDQGTESANDLRSAAFQQSLSKLQVVTWVERFRFCYPEHIWRAQYDDLDENQRAMRREKYTECVELADSLRVDAYLALQATALEEQFRYIAGEPGLGKAEYGNWLQLVFGKRIGNRFELKLCPTWNWDGLEVLFVTYEFDDVLGDTTIDEIWHPAVAGRPDEQLCTVIERALVAAMEVEAEVHSWMRQS